MKNIIYTSQTRMGFDMDRLLKMGIDRAYVWVLAKNNECLDAPEVILSRLEQIAQKAKAAADKGLEIYPFFNTINHPEGNYQLPPRYRRQRNLDGTERSAFICFRDSVRQEEMIRFAEAAARLGFKRMAFDDDLRDAFCYCDEHLNGFEPFRGKSRPEIAEILNGVLDHPEHEQLRLDWYRYKYEGMKDYARRLERAIHSVNPACRIGLCTSAKRCQDFSGRSPWPWAQFFHTDDAPIFLRLAGECYFDDLLSLAQSTGWHEYFNYLYPKHVERMLEICSAPSISYRCPGTVIFETETAMAATAAEIVHWACVPDFDVTGLSDLTGPAKKAVAKIRSQVSHLPVSPLALYVGHELGAYTPPNICATYGVTDDPISAYNITSLVGLPIVPMPTIPADQPAIMCCGYISRNMIKEMDRFVTEGGAAILDATAAKGYRVYGGQAAFAIEGPVSRHRYELDPDGQRDDTIAECLPDVVHLISGVQKDAACWQGYDLDGNMTGFTTAILPHGKGKLVVLGYNLSRTRSTLVRPQWQQRMLKMLDMAGVTFPVYWSGPAAVQCFYYGDKVALANYNTNQVTGKLVVEAGSDKSIELGSLELKFVDL